MKLITSLLLVLMTMNHTYALECQGEECYEQVAAGEETLHFATPDAAHNAWSSLKARMDVNQDGNFQVEAAALSATAGTLGASAIAGYATYAQKASATNKAAFVMREQAKVIKVALEKGLAPEIQRFATALIKRNARLAAEGAAQMTEAEIANFIKTGLQNPTVKNRIMGTITRFLSGTTAKNQAKELAEHVFHIAVRDGIPVLERTWPRAMKDIAWKVSSQARLGATLAGNIARAVTPRAAHFAGRRIIAEVLKTGGKGLLGTCKLFGRNLLSSRALAVLTGGWATGALIMLDSTKVADGTLRGLYAGNPEALLHLSEEEARRMMEYPSVRNSIVSLHDLI